MFSLRTLLLTPVFLLPPLIAWRYAGATENLLAPDSIPLLIGIFYLHVSFFCYYVAKRTYQLEQRGRWLAVTIVGGLLGFACAGAMALAAAAARQLAMPSGGDPDDFNRLVFIAGEALVWAVIGAAHGGSVGACVVACYAAWQPNSRDRSCNKSGQLSNAP